MGRKVRETEHIVDQHIRRITMKKRRINLVKRAMQLSLLADCQISISIYWKEDKSMLEYLSVADDVRKTRHDPEVLQYAGFDNTNYKLCEEVEKQLNKHGRMDTHSELS